MKARKSMMLAVLSLGMLASCGQNTSSAGYVDNYKNLKGFDIDLAKAACEELDITPVFQEIVWEQKETELSAKQIDLIWNGLTITDERKESLEISLPYMSNTQALVVKKDFADDSITAEDNYTIAFEQGSAGEDAFNNTDMFKGSTSAGVTAQVTALTEVLSGTSDIAIIDSIMAGYYLTDTSSYGSKLKILSGYDFETENYGIAGRKGDTALIAKLNETIETLYNNGTTNSIADTYGLKNDLIKPDTYTKFDAVEDKSSWEYIQNKGSIIIGYTVFAPIAFEA
ncbi:MAG: transporter substrate-binding domain-containing protein [Bacilli bacterium]|nr:transporter substrate-binding domain-containing protein [Bacilli bacterium]